jgi:hypothetical protein
VKLYRTQYKDFGPTLATEKLFERDGIKLNDETLRMWLIESGGLEENQKETSISSVERAETVSRRDDSNGWISSRLA